MRVNKLLLTLAMFATLLSCSPSKNTSFSLNTSGEVDILALYQIAWEQLFAQQAENYLVYIYSETCYNCHAIEEEIIAFAFEGITSIFFVDIKNQINHIPITDELESSYGATFYQDVSILGTPTIIEILKGVLIANVAGTETVLALLYEKRLNIGK